MLIIVGKKRGGADDLNKLALQRGGRGFLQKWFFETLFYVIERLVKSVTKRGGLVKRASKLEAAICRAKKEKKGAAHR